MKRIERRERLTGGKGKREKRDRRQGGKGRTMQTANGHLRRRQRSGAGKGIEAGGRPLRTVRSPAWESLARGLAGTTRAAQESAENLHLLLDLCGPLFDQTGELNLWARRALIHFQQEKVRCELDLGAGLADLLQEHLDPGAGFGQVGGGGKDALWLRVPGCHVDLVLLVPG